MPLDDAERVRALIPIENPEHARAWSVPAHGTNEGDFFIVTYVEQKDIGRMAVCQVIAPNAEAEPLAYILKVGLPAEMISASSSGSHSLVLKRMGYEWLIFVEPLASEAGWVEVTTYRHIE